MGTSHQNVFSPQGRLARVRNSIFVEKLRVITAPPHPDMLVRWFRHLVQLRGDPLQDPEHAGQTMSLRWTGNALESSQKSFKASVR